MQQWDRDGGGGDAGETRRRQAGWRSQGHHRAPYMISHRVMYLGVPRVGQKGMPLAMAIAAALCAVRRPTPAMAAPGDDGYTTTAPRATPKRD
jgi:hypothetical protein